jgi:hypothetical protein
MIKELSASLCAAGSESLDKPIGHIQVKAAFVRGKQNVDDSISESRQARLGVVGPVLHGLDESPYKTAELAQAGFFTGD